MARRMGPVDREAWGGIHWGEGWHSKALKHGDRATKDGSGHPQPIRGWRLSVQMARSVQLHRRIAIRQMCIG